MTRITTVLLVAGLSPAQALAAVPLQQLTTANAGEVGMSQPVLDAATTLYAEAVARGDIAGVVLLVARHGKVVLHRALGWSDRERRVPMATNTLMDIASMTKPLVATAALILAERGQLRLDDPVSHYIPRVRQRPFRQGDDSGTPCDSPSRGRSAGAGNRREYPTAA